MSINLRKQAKNITLFSNIFPKWLATLFIASMSSVLKINSLQSVTNSQENYLDIMAENLSVLSKALEVKGE